MNAEQELWWQQAQSDYEIFTLMRKQGVADCHKLHYLQMATEKLAKAYLWKTGNAPPKSHVGFVKFLRMIGSARSSERERIAQIFCFGNYNAMQSWIRTSISPIAYELERITPDLANDGPNPEYPWPHAQPERTPVTFEFSIWKTLRDHSKGRELLNFINAAIKHFPDYAAI